MTIVVHTADARALWQTIRDNMGRIDDGAVAGDGTWKKDDSERATKVFYAPKTGEYDKRAYFVGTVRTGQLLLLDLLPGNEPLNWQLFGILHGRMVSLLMTAHPDEILSLNVFPNRPVPAA
ncbi:hypothetical protein [Bordetella genomosp. 1]|uniref:SRPBCC family protein n=1 Tax=Bordetella genomosp. 1 TaxID=1395607 RepID=A0ABX4F216_9BORD|nr:hypothetical protein [Bordetella genomosp. 1]MDQ8033886.1 hypothetical protein [Bordetella sp.]OZI65965.1 hypothetical protein CAL27_13345 [Bordetella genomosp. 1]